MTKCNLCPRLHRGSFEQGPVRCYDYAEEDLHRSVCNDQYNEVFMLLADGVDVNARSGNAGFTPLMCATRYGHTRVAQLLLRRGAMVDAADELGMTALLHAARVGNVEMAELLIEEGANRTAVEKNGQSALTFARLNRDARMEETILNHTIPEV